jgi:nucleotide-binding universal stress UspA family protein
MQTVIAAIDLGPSSSRVLLHAAGFARLLSCTLKVLHVDGGVSENSQAHVLEFCRNHAPYEIDIGAEDVIVAPGLVSDVILREAIRNDARLVVVGSRGHSRFAKLILGSTSEAVLRGATVPVLLVPPNDVDIVSITDRAALTCGPVLVAVDLAEPNNESLAMAGDLAWRTKQPLMMMTVAPQRLDHDAADALLRDHGRRLGDQRPRALIVRRGDVAEEISLCARREGSGLVVMGLRTRPRATPGAIASAVLNTNRAFVLAVPAALSA